MSAYFATAYTIHFDDTMAYGSHHFLTSFKFQCAAREAYLFGERVFDLPGVKEALDRVHLLTADAYTRNLQPTQLGDRVVILLTLEDWGQASARFCYRVMNQHGQKICAGFQTLVCADASTGNPTTIPKPLRDAMDAMRLIEEKESSDSFRDRVLSGGTKLDSLFEPSICEVAKKFLSERYPKPDLVSAATSLADAKPTVETKTIERQPQRAHHQAASGMEAWVFAGQGAFNAELFCDRVVEYRRRDRLAASELEQAAAIAAEMIGGNAQALMDGSLVECLEAVKTTPELMQVGIHLQNVLGARLWMDRGHRPRVLMGHSFGEIAAVSLGGGFDLVTGVRAVCMRSQAIRAHAPHNGGLLAVGAERFLVQTEAQLLSLDQVVVAGRNHDRQTIASGPRDQLQRLQECFQNRQVDAKVVRSPTSFHHPDLQSAASMWRDQLRELPIAQLSEAVYSPIGRRFLTRSDDIPHVLSSQLLRPFDLQGALLDLAAAGITRFIDCGTTGALAALLSQVVPGENVSRVSLTKTSRVSVRPVARLLQPASAAKPIASGTAVAVTAGSPTLLGGEGNFDDARQEQTQPDKAPTIAHTLAPVLSVVGSGCILPGGASSPEQLFTAITNQRLGIVDQRDFDPYWAEDFYSENLVADRSTSHLAGRVNDSDLVAPAGVDPSVFDRFTRTQQLLSIGLAGCLSSLEGAEKIVCLVGATADGFEDQDEAFSLVYSGIDPSNSFVDQRMNSARSANRTPHDAVQEVFDHMLRPGLQVTLVDAACASSLYTIALGMRLLESDKADAVIAGGVFCPGPGNSCLFSQFRGTTATGCRPFDAQADGVVFSEGAAFVTLRPKSEAKRLGLDVLADLRGAGLSSDGKSSSANVPQTHGQILSLQRCYQRYGIDPSSIHAVEGHGTSTPVGDATELNTLQRFFADHVSDPIPVHSLKATLGHAGWAAGATSVIAACEYLRRRTFPAQACFQQPSEAARKAEGTLSVLTEPRSFDARPLRIAIDGFGFGGANAHVVVQSADQESQLDTEGNHHRVESNQDDSIVVVALHQVLPDQNTAAGRRFDREKIKLPERFVVLPDLADDMDISQMLTVTLANGVVQQLPELDPKVREQTSVVVALRGKTERGVEATTRVMGRRLRRHLAGDDRLQTSLDTAIDRARPSRSYTLQCMMPNVAAGRAALMLNLNGPNFVVDSGEDSFSSAIASASLLLRSGDQGGTKFAIVASVAANANHDFLSSRREHADEHAIALGLTTRQFAREQGWTEISEVDDVISQLQSQGHTSVVPSGDTTPADTGTQLTERSDNVPEGTNASGDDYEAESIECPIHHPVWVEKVPDRNPTEAAIPSPQSILAIIPASTDEIDDLIEKLSSFAPRVMLAVVGNDADQVVSRLEHTDAIAVQADDVHKSQAAIEQLEAFHADVIVVIQSPASWRLMDSLTATSQDNRVCEFLFSVAQRHLSRLQQGKIQLFSVLSGGWNGVVHPRAAAITGLLKSLHREFPAVRTCSLSTRGAGWQDSLHALQLEYGQCDREQEVVYDGSVRLVRRLRATREAIDPVPQVSLDRSSVVVASGGARGVTAVMLEALLQDHACTVIALGRSPLEAGPENPDDVKVEQEFYRRWMLENPDQSPVQMKKAFEATRARWEAHRTIDDLRRLGGKVEYQVVDITDPVQVDRAIQQIVSTFGRIDLLLHGAGVQWSKRLQHRTLDDFRKTYSVKVAGLHHLVESCQTHLGKLVGVHVLTSAYSIFGNDGQHDYGAANETMDRLCELSGWDNQSRWSSIAWLAWDGVGMTRGSEYSALARQRRLTGVNRTTGQKIFRDVIGGRTSSAINVPLSSAEHVEYQIQTIPQGIGNPSTEGIKLEMPVVLSKFDCLPFHQVRRVPTLPGAWTVELFVHAALKLVSDDARSGHVEVRDVTFRKLVRRRNAQDADARVVVEKINDKIYAWMIADVLHPGGHVLAKDVICAKAVLSFRPEFQDLRPRLGDLRHDLGDTDLMTAKDPYCSGTLPEVELQDSFDCIDDITISPRGRRARLVCDPDCEWSGDIPALALDAAWRLGAMHASPDHPRLFVPVEIGRMILPVQPDRKFATQSGWTITSSRPRVDHQNARWQRTEVYDAAGRLCMVVQDAFAKCV